MKSPSTKYITGYVFRFLLGTCLVLCLISLARIHLNRRNKITITDPTSVWEKSLIYPDQLVNLILKKYATELLDAPTEQDQSQTPAPTPQDSIWSQTANVDNSTTEQDTNTPFTMNDTPHAPAMPNMPDMPDMPSMPDMPDTSAGPDAPPTTQSENVVQNLSDTGEWGLTINSETPIYSMKGKRQGQIPAGNIFEVHSHKSSSKGNLLICTIIRNGKVYPKTIIPQEHTILYKCNLSEITDRQRNLSTQHAKLLGQISDRERELKKNAESQNPYSEKYKQALASYKIVAKKNNALLKEYNNSTGARRMQVADKLRLIKHDSEESKKEFSDIKTQYNNWKTQNTTGDVDFSRDSQIRSLRQKVATIERQLSNP